MRVYGVAALARLQRRPIHFPVIGMHPQALIPATDSHLRTRAFYLCPPRATHLCPPRATHLCPPRAMHLQPSRASHLQPSVVRFGILSKRNRKISITILPTHRDPHRGRHPDHLCPRLAGYTYRSLERLSGGKMGWARKRKQVFLSSKSNLGLQSGKRRRKRQSCRNFRYQPPSKIGSNPSLPRNAMQWKSHRLRLFALNWHRNTIGRHSLIKSRPSTDGHPTLRLLLRPPLHLHLRPPLHLHLRPPLHLHLRPPLLHHSLRSYSTIYCPPWVLRNGARSALR